MVNDGVYSNNEALKKHLKHNHPWVIPDNYFKSCMMFLEFHFCVCLYLSWADVGLLQHPR